MYLFLDESGEQKTPIEYKKDSHTEFFFTFSILLIEDRESKSLIEKIVVETREKICNEHLKRGWRLPKELAKGELKGRILKKFPSIETEFFQSIADPMIKCCIYSMLIDKRELQQPLPEMEKRERRIAWFFRFLFLDTFVPPKSQQVMMLQVDLRDETRTSEGRWRFNKMLRDSYKNKMREVNRERLKEKLSKYGDEAKAPVLTRLLIAHVDSVRQPALQAADVFAHFGYRKLQLFKRDDLILDDRLREERNRWTSLKKIIRPKIAVWREPKFLTYR